MKQSTLYAFVLLTLVPIHMHAAETYHGAFIHYEGAEYESAFIPFETEEVWGILGGPNQQQLVARAMATKSREIQVSLILDVTPIDKTKYPQSHYSGTAKVVQILESVKVTLADLLAKTREFENQPVTVIGYLADHANLTLFMAEEYEVARAYSSSIVVGDYDEREIGLSECIDAMVEISGVMYSGSAGDFYMGGVTRIVFTSTNEPCWTRSNE